MLRNKTVFVLGAGASCGYGFPVGTDYHDRIVSCLLSKRGGVDRNVLAARKLLKRLLTTSDMDKISNDMRDAIAECGTIFEGSHLYSIDRWMMGLNLQDLRQKKFFEIGQAAITAVIVASESESEFIDPPSNPKDENELRWYGYLYNRMHDKCGSAAQFGENSLRIITFNYDRSLEHFLYRSLRNTFLDPPNEEIAAAIKMFPIIHAYGKVGALPWEKSKENSRPYAYICSREELMIARKGVQIASLNQSRLKRDCIKSLLHDAAAICFLGFGFDDLNLNQLFFGDNSSLVLPYLQTISGTTFGMSPVQITDACGVITKLLSSCKLDVLVPASVVVGQLKQQDSRYKCLEYLKNCPFL